MRILAGRHGFEPARKIFFWRGRHMAKLRRLGNTDLLVTPIGLGTWQFSGGRIANIGIWATLDQRTIDEIVAAALENGVNWFDTAELYGFGKSEQGLARAILNAGRRPGDVLIATKWRPILRTAGSIRRTIDRRLKALQPFGIDLYQVHFPFMTFSSIESQMDAMADLVEAGKIGAVGVSNFDPEQMKRAFRRLDARGIPLASNQVKYSLLDRRIESNGVLETAKDLGVSIIAYSPLEMGLLTGKFHKDEDLLKRTPFLRRRKLAKRLEESRPVVQVLEEIASRHGATPAQIALSWLISYHGDLVVAIPGATKVHHAVESARAMEIRLTDEEISLVDNITKKFK
jgi:aryl-alcohol dehydrogenase-like predicted oxidoreductase